ncbi:MAG: sugar transferase [Candidatus Doudnabacteria bacterium]|nr:sugar transferase [Candidatus Doudnabacteria bacterium]
MKKTELIFNVISIPVDALMLLLAGVVSFYLRGDFTHVVGPIAFRLDFGEFLSLVYKIIFLLLLTFAAMGLYNLRGTRRLHQELGRVAVGISLGLLVVMLLFFFNQSIFPSRFIILATWALGIILVMAGRLILKLVQLFLFEKNIGLHKLVIIDGGPVNLEVIEQVFKNRRHGYEVTAELNFNEMALERLAVLCESGRVDEILQANSGLSDDVNLQLVQFARNRGIKFSFVPNLFEVQRNIIETESLNGVPVISLKNTPLDGWGKVVKRILDVVAAGFCLVITSPLFLLIYIVIQLDSPGKAIYSAKRGGRYGDFWFYKFRTMYSHLSVGEGYGGSRAEQIRRELWKKNNRGGEQGPFLKVKDDPRVTKFGKFLRRSKLDEIPQFWNVLKGDMSMVGPRAHVLDEVQKYKSRYARMFSIKPGIFGLSQNAQASWPDLPFEEEIRLNILYIENWSLWLDVKTLAKSFWLLFFGSKTKDNY